MRTLLIMKHIATPFSFLVFVLLSLTGQIASSQLFVQIEELNKVETIKLYPGDKFQYQLKGYEKSWDKGVIGSIDPAINAIFIKESMYQIDEFSAIRVSGPFAPRAVGVTFQTFGIGWLGFGILGRVFSNGTFKAQEAIIGAVAIGVGYLFRSFYRWDTVQLNENNRLRIMDVRMVVPTVDN